MDVIRLHIQVEFVGENVDLSKPNKRIGSTFNDGSGGCSVGHNGGAFKWPVGRSLSEKQFPAHTKFVFSPFSSVRLFIAAFFRRWLLRWKEGPLALSRFICWVPHFCSRSP
jgi:hypothetical protein